MENSNQLRTWLDDMQLDHPLLIAGPCSAETESQVLEIAHQLKDTHNFLKPWNCGIKSFREFMSHFFAKNVMSGRGQTIATHTTIVLIFISGLAI